MPAIRQVLWIEDSANFELSELLGPVYYHGGYILDIAESASEATELLSLPPESPHTPLYDAIIVDIRLPPGHHTLWQKLYKQTIRGTVETQLGLLLLYWMLGKTPCADHAHEIKTMKRALEDLKTKYDSPNWITPSQIAIFTVERKGQLQQRQHLDCLGLQNNYFQKSLNTPDDILLRIVQHCIK